MSTGRQSTAFLPIIHRGIAIRAEMVMVMFVGPVGACIARISRVRPAESECQCSAIVQRNVAAALRGRRADSLAGVCGVSSVREETAFLFRCSHLFSILSYYSLYPPLYFPYEALLYSHRHRSTSSSCSARLALPPLQTTRTRLLSLSLAPFSFKPHAKTKHRQCNYQEPWLL